MKQATETILRQWTMLQKIPRHPGSVGTRELKGKLEEDGFQVDVRTIQRDLGKLSAIFPLSSEEYGKALRWFWMADSKVMDLPGMDSHAALAFQLAGEHLSHLLPKATLRHLEPHFNRAKEVLASARINRLSLWADKVRVLAWGPTLLLPKVRADVHDAVYGALLEDRQIEVTYKRKDSEQRKTYPVNPLGIVFREGIVYLICTVKDYDDVRHLPLHRMSSAKMLEVPCRRPKGFDLDAFLKGNEALDYPVGRESVRLEVLFDKRCATHLEERPLSRNQRLSPHKDGRVLLRATVRDTLALRWWLLGYGDEVEVVAPKALREEFKAIARRMVNIYS